MTPSTEALGERSPRIANDVADFPEPDSPTRPNVSPASMWKETSSTAICCPKRIFSEETSSRGELDTYFQYKGGLPGSQKEALRGRSFVAGTASNESGIVNL